MAETEPRAAGEGREGGHDAEWVSKALGAVGVELGTHWSEDEGGAEGGGGGEGGEGGGGLGTHWKPLNTSQTLENPNQWAHIGVRMRGVTAAV